MLIEFKIAKKCEYIVRITGIKYMTAKNNPRLLGFERIFY